MSNDKITVDEMRKMYSETHPFEPNNRRVGDYAKELGYKLAKQMKNRKVTYFYIKSSSM